MVTVFTPAYNAQKTIGRLYESLKRQTEKDLQWVVVNDGSTDNTEKLINSYIDENILNIKYGSFENQGKYSAYNKGLDLADGEYFICVDADDYIPDDTIHRIACQMDFIKDDDRCCGIVALKEIIGQSDIQYFPKDNEILSLKKIEFEYKTAGEKTYVFKTEYAKEARFIDILPEKFFPELFIYDMLGEKYTFMAVNEVFTVCEYQPEGYTSNYRKLMLNNPTGFAYLYKQRMLFSEAFLQKAGMAMRYNAFQLMSKNSKKPRGGCPFLRGLMLLPSLALIFRYKYL